MKTRILKLKRDLEHDIRVNALKTSNIAVYKTEHRALQMILADAVEAAHTAIDRTFAVELNARSPLKEEA